MRHVLLCLTFLLFLLNPFTTAGQEQVRIIDATAIARTDGPLKDRNAIAGMEAAGISEEEKATVVRNSAPELWPLGLADDSARAADLPYIRNYNAYRLCRYKEDTLAWSIVMLPARENLHMPEELRPTADLFLLVPDAALEKVEPAKKRPEISRGPSWRAREKVSIVTPDALYATYDLGHDEAGMKALRDQGMSTAEVDAVVFRCHESNWPEGIDTFDERYPRLDQFKKYKAYLGAAWDDKVLVIVPFEKNRRMPILMRPYVDIYMVYARTGVQIKGGKNRK
ncbi:MAG: hypothetical protein H6594_01965 [Flavobacteriales bacterium]|nr:hypothetical protein [Flavobacteriales bacterium]